MDPIDSAIPSATDFQKLKNRALRLLARRDHSIRELKTKLSMKSLAEGSKMKPEDFERLVSYLKNLGYLGDEKNLASRWIKAWREQGRGRYWISGKLKIKGLSTNDLHDDEEEIESLRSFLRKKLSSHEIAKLSLAEKAKLSKSLTLRGYSRELISQTLRDPDFSTL